jgi:acetyl-CoA C-acetyltransferase
MQDQYAATSLARAQRATTDKSFAQEIAPIPLGKGANARAIASDELPGKAKAQDIPRLKPAFREDGTITAANASAISDGAAALALMRVDDAERAGATPLAIVRGYVTVAGAPSRFSIMPIEAIRRLMERVGWTTSNVDLFEINEAFAVVAMAAMCELDLPHEKVNVRGGACALGHPIGASGARIIVTLLAALEAMDRKKGVAALCIGGGEATAVAIERVS